MTPEVEDLLAEMDRLLPERVAAILRPWLKAHSDEIELAIQQSVPLDMVLKSTHTLSNEGC